MILILFVMLAFTAKTFGLDEIARFTLDETTSCQVVTEPGYMTSLVFPGPIADVSGGSISADNAQAQFMVQWDPGAPIVKVKPRFPNASTNVNVTYGGKVYVVNLATAEKGTKAVYFGKAGGASVGTGVATTLENHEAVSASRMSTDSSSTSTGISNGPAPALTVTQLLALLDRSKEFDLLRQYAPRYIRGTYRAFPKRVFEYRNFTATLLEVVRWDASDTLMFKVALTSKGPDSLEYQPEQTRVRLYNRLFPTSIRDMSGIIPSKGEPAIVWFGITGTADDQRNSLAPDQEWTVLIKITNP